MKYFFFEKNLEDIIRFSGDASTPDSDFWRHMP